MSQHSVKQRDNLDIGASQRTLPGVSLENPVAMRGRIIDGKVAVGIRKSTLPILEAITSVRIPFYFLTFLLFVVVPSIASTIYFAWLASDQYVVEARFAVRSAPSNKSSMDDLKSALSSATSSPGSGMTMATQDAFIIVHYLRSRAAIDDVSKTVNLREIYSRPGVDFWARLPKDATIEKLTEYWRDMVFASVDGPSGIVSVYVRAFQPEDAKIVAKALLASTDRLINNLSERARRDVLETAETEVRRSEAAVRRALLDLRSLRDKEGILDPGTAASGTSELLFKALAERIRVQNELMVSSQSLNANSPTVKNLKSQLDALDTQLVSLREQMTSNDKGTRTVSSFLVRFEELEIQRIFSEKMYMIAQNSLERARARLEQKQVYLTVFVPPEIPQEAKYPERLAYSLILPLIFIICWGIFALIWAAVEDHSI